MATARPSYGSEEMSKAQKDLSKIKTPLDEMLTKMKKDSSYTPNVQELDKYGENILQYISKYHNEAAKTKEHLKAAVVDLTEIPLMHPQMQRVAIQTALKAACENIAKFASATF